MVLEFWSEEKIIKSIQLLHQDFIKSKRKSSVFSYTYVREQNSKLTSATDIRKIKWIELLVKSGLDPRCHIRSVSYGETTKEKKKTFRLLITEFISIHGKKNLNDNEINSDIPINVPEGIFLNYKESGICKKSNCKPFQITGRSIYTKGRSIYGNWKKALEDCGLDYENEVLRRISQHSLFDVIEMFDEWDKKRKGKWIIIDLRSDLPLERAIQNSFINKNRSFPFSKKSHDKVFVAWMTLIYCRKFKKIEENDVWWRKNYKKLSNEFDKNHRGQEKWITDKSRGEQGSWEINQKIIEGIHEIFSEEVRLTRDSINISTNPRFKTIWSAMRQKRFRDAKKFENEWLKDAGFIPERLSKIYYELDKPYSTNDVMFKLSGLMKESIQNNENRLSREYCSINHPEFTNFIIAQHKSWEKGLRFYGLDPKFFNISSSKRGKRGYQFQEFVREMFKRYGLEERKTKLSISEFTYNKSIQSCRHKVKCRPDFNFGNLIIDTKTGYHASQKPEQLSRYFDHSGQVIVLVLKGKSRVEKINKKPIEVINFKDFIDNSKKILNINLELSEEQELTKTLKRNPFWKN